MSKAGPNATFPNGRSTAKTVDWPTLLAMVAAQPDGALWRHNQAGDLPQDGHGIIDAGMVAELAKANQGKRGFTYTHHDMSHEANRQAVADANAAGLTVNVSANNLADADSKADLGIGPVVTVLPDDVHGRQDIATPMGRKVVVCPATYRDDISCATCGLCAVRDRKVIVGFPAHGAGARKAGAVARG